MAVNKQSEYVVMARGMYNSHQAVVRTDLLLGNDDGAFGVYNSELKKCTTRVKYDPQIHLFRVALFHDKDKGKGNLIAGNAPASIVERGQMKPHSNRPGDRYLTGYENEHGDRVVGVWSFYFELSAEQVEEMHQQQEGRAKVMFELEDADWDEDRFVPTKLKLWAEESKNSTEEAEAEPQQEEAA